MDFKVAGTKEGITSLQMDIKITGITFEIMEQALNQAKAGREHILGEMSKAIKDAISVETFKDVEHLGGAAAAVASGIVPMANASDGGGSIRIPASCCGLFVLKPTRGRVPIGPFAMEGWGGLSTSHAVTKTVRDSALLLDCTQGPEPGSPYHAPKLNSSFFETLSIEPGKCRIALCVDTFNCLLYTSPSPRDS